MSHPLGSKYELHELLGRGAMGQVFRGSVRSDGYPVAVKVLKPELISEPEVIARFLQERSILTSISHPHVVRVLDLVVEGETAGIVMELVPGQDLRHYLSACGTLPAAHAVYFARQLLEGTAAVHAAGIIHRDVKPGNVLVDASGDEVILKLTDFGIARLSYGSALTQQPSLLGTPEYMAPEVADSAPATPAADLYSVGIVLYEMLAGRTPFAGGHPMSVLHRQLEQLPVPIPGTRTDLWALVEWLLAKDPQARPSSAAEAAAALGRLEPDLAEEPALPPMPPLSELPAPPRAARPARSLMLSHPGPQEYPDRHAPTGDWTRDAPPPPLSRAGRPAARAPGPPWSRAPRPLQSRVNQRLVLAVVAAAALVLAGAAGVWLSRPSPGAAAAVPAAVSHAFAPQEYPDGLLIVRRWTLGGKHGSLLTETVSASSATGRALRVPFQDEIPAAVARTTQTVVFTPAPAKIVQADPVVEWLLRLPSQGTVQVGYHASSAGPGRDHDPADGPGERLRRAAGGHLGHTHAAYRPACLAGRRAGRRAAPAGWQHPAGNHWPAAQRPARARGHPGRCRMECRKPSRGQRHLARDSNRGEHGQHPGDRADRRCPGLSARNSRRC